MHVLVGLAPLVRHNRKWGVNLETLKPVIQHFKVIQLHKKGAVTLHKIQLVL